MKYDDSSKFYLVNRDYDVVEVIDGYKNLLYQLRSDRFYIRKTYSRLDPVDYKIGDSFGAYEAILHHHRFNTFSVNKRSVEYIIFDEMGCTVCIKKLLQESHDLESDRKYTKRKLKYKSMWDWSEGDHPWEFRKDPVPHRGGRKYLSCHRKISVKAEYQEDCYSGAYSRPGRRRLIRQLNLENWWGDIPRSDRRDRHSWKKRKKRKQWMKA